MEQKEIKRGEEVVGGTPFIPPQLEKSWQEALADEWNKPYLLNLAQYLAQERRGATPIYPPAHQVFAAFESCPFGETKVVIVGQDPYHGPGQAHGLSFSVAKGVSQPPSLRNIYKELYSDLALTPPPHGCLSSWAEQGVLLLNATLTVRAKEPKSHHGRGWEQFTDKVIHALAERKKPPIFVLWGKSAEHKCSFLSEKEHIILRAAHPSPYSAHHGFFGCRHFSKINEHLKRQGMQPINWAIV